MVLESEKVTKSWFQSSVTGGVALGILRTKVRNGLFTV